MHRPQGRRGLSRLVIPVVVIVIVAVGGAYVFLTRTPTTPPTSSASSTPSVPLRTVVNQLVQDINSRNVDGAITFYGPNAVVVWSGHTGGLVGKYTGPANVRLIYAASVGKTSQLGANLSKYAEDVFSPTHINSTFALAILGNSTVLGALNATVNVSEEWSWSGANWQILRENWAYSYFFAQYLSSQYGSATTFPQWGYMQEGGNPNLVSEKSFEWHAGPYLAMAAYAFLFGIVAFLALRWKPIWLRIRSRAPSGSSR